MKKKSRLGVVLPIFVAVLALVFGSISSATAETKSFSLYTGNAQGHSSSIPTADSWAVAAAVVVAVVVVVVVVVAVTVTTLEGAPPIDPAPVTASNHGAPRMDHDLALKTARLEFDR